MRDKWQTFPARQPGVCDEPSCCAPVTRKSKRTGEIARFCGEPCRRKYEYRAHARGLRIYETAMRWRCSPRSHRKGAKNPPTKFGDVTALLDEFLREDRDMRDGIATEIYIIVR